MADDRQPVQATIDTGSRSIAPRAAVPCGDVLTLLAYEAGRRDMLDAVITSASTMTRTMLIQWLEKERANG